MIRQASFLLFAASVGGIVLSLACEEGRVGVGWMREEGSRRMGDGTEWDARAFYLCVPLTKSSKEGIKERMPMFKETWNISSSSAS